MINIMRTTAKHSHSSKIPIKNVFSINQVSHQFFITSSNLFLFSDSWKYGDSIHSSVTIFSRSLAFNYTYQFMVQMINQQNPSLHSIGYLFVRVESMPSPMIIIRLVLLVLFYFLSFFLPMISCVISTMCSSTSQSNYVNSNTELGFYSLCLGHCPTNLQMKWNIYQRTANSSWILINPILSIGIFGIVSYFSEKIYCSSILCQV